MNEIALKNLRDSYAAQLDYLKLQDSYTEAFTKSLNLFDSSHVSGEANDIAEPSQSKQNVLFTREQIIESSAGNLADVFGPEYADVDQYKVRARVPLPPFLFISRILEIDATPGVWEPSKIVMEYDIPLDTIFQLNGKTMLAPFFESSHVSIFLMSYMV